MTDLAPYVLTAVSSPVQRTLSTRKAPGMPEPFVLWVRVGETKVPARVRIIGIRTGQHEGVLATRVGFRKHLCFEP